MPNPTVNKMAIAALIGLIAVLAIACSESDAGLSRADVAEVVRSELANAPEPADSGPSAAEVERMVQDSIAGIPEPVPGVTIEEVERIVRDSIADIPAPELTRSDVERFFEAAIENIQVQELPSTMKLEVMTEAKSGYVPLKSSPDDYTQYLVKDAIKRYETDGLDATVAYYNTPESIDGQWYVFIGDENDVMLAHAANPDLVGRPFSYATGPNAYPAGSAVAASADEDGEWFSYTYPNPATGAVETKHSWTVTYDGLLFGTGWYEAGPAKSDAPAYTQALVRQAIALYDAVGLDDTVAYYNNPESIDGQWYVFIGDEEDMMLAHAANPDLVGQPFSYAKGPNDYPAGEAVAASADQDGEWFSYTYPNPETGGVETKHSWMVRYDGLLFGTGWYGDGPAKSDAPAYTKAFVQQAIKLYDAVGRDRTIDYYNTTESVDGQWYIFIIDEDGYTISHRIPEFIGRDPALRVDATGYFFGDELTGATEAGRWIDYVFNDPNTGEEQQKHTWAVRHDGLIFASGWYEE